MDYLFSGNNIWLSLVVMILVMWKVGAKQNLLGLVIALGYIIMGASYFGLKDWPTWSLILQILGIIIILFGAFSDIVKKQWVKIDKQKHPEKYPVKKKDGEKISTKSLRHKQKKADRAAKRDAAFSKKQ
jgi:hypothetical protein